MSPTPLCVCADATQPEGYRQVLGDAPADLLLTDPPYCLLTRRRKGGDLRDPRARKIDREPVVRFESVREYRTFTEQWLSCAVKFVVPEAPLIIWTNVLGKPPIVEVARGLGYLHLWGEFVWAKRTREVNSNEQMLRVYEIALVLSRTPPAPFDLSAPPTPWSVVTGYDDEGEGPEWGEHPHHKPFGSVAPLVLAWSRPGARILDPFGGSGSIPLAALRLGRRTACLEKVPHWAARINDRLQSASSDAAPT